MGIMKSIQNDGSLNAGSDGYIEIKKDVNATYYETDTSFSTFGTFKNQIITRADIYNSINNAILTNCDMHIVISNSGSNNITFESVARLIQKLTLFINNVEVLKINNVDNCALLEQLQRLRSARTPEEFTRLIKRAQGRTAASSNLPNTIASGASVTAVVDL